MKVEGVNIWNLLGTQNFQIEKNRPISFLTKDEVEFFEQLFPDNAEEIRKYYQYDANARQVFETGQIINRRI